MGKSKKISLYYNFIFLLVILIGISSFFFTYFLNMFDTDVSVEKLSVRETSHISYSVKEINSNTYNHNSDTFPLNNIDTINTYFNFTLSTDDEIIGDYSYAVMGYEVFGNKNIIERNIYKGPMKTFEVTGKVINLGDTIEIKVPNILTDLNNYKLNNNISDEAKIKYVITVYYNVFSEKLSKTISQKKELFVEIPVTDIAKITTSDTVNEKREEISSLDTKDNEIYLAIALEFMGAVIMFILIIMLLVKEISKESDQYTLILEKILKKYKDIIVHVSEVPDLSNLEVLFVDDFEDLVDAAVNLNQVINYTDIVKGKVSTFVVINKKIAYVYKLSR